MFFELKLKRDVILQPHELKSGMYLTGAVLSKLVEDLNLLKCTEEHGYYVAATTLESIGQGRIRSVTGSVVFAVEFNCLVFKPYKGEIVESVVSQITRTGFEARCGPFESLFVHQKMMEGFEFHEAQSPGFNTFKDSQGTEIQKDTVVRVKLIALRWDDRERTYRALATLNDDYMGPVQAFETGLDLNK
ncbi:hypothetical protein O6H91_Y200400 [Diphasiastrum complanatum]|nr:hypothetical protein O6H91_Y200400 [Diphasiastrum complanatum]